MLVGGYEELSEQPVASRSDVEFLCFTDDPGMESETWTIRPIEALLPCDPVRSQRQLKIRAHSILPDYDLSLYLDNSVHLRRTPEEILAALLPADSSVAMVSHSFRTTVADEFRTVIAAGLDRADRCEEQARHYLEHDPYSLALRPMWSGLLLRRHNDPHVVEAMDRWFLHVLRYSRRDQLSSHFAFRALDLEPLVHELDNHASEFHDWPMDRNRRDDSSLWDGPDVVVLEDRVRELEAQLATLRSSQSSRLTRPVRRLRARFTRSPHPASSASTSPEPSHRAVER